MTNREEFRLVVEVNADEASGLRQVLEAAIPGAQILEVEGGFHVEGTLRGDSARDVNRSLLSALRRVQHKTRVRSQWTRHGITERFFDYVPKGTSSATGQGSCEPGEPRR